MLNKKTSAKKSQIPNKMPSCRDGKLLEEAEGTWGEQAGALFN